MAASLGNFSTDQEILANFLEIFWKSEYFGNILNMQHVE